MSGRQPGLHWHPYERRVMVMSTLRRPVVSRHCDARVMHRCSARCTGKRRTEGSFINKSLLTLATVISKIVKQDGVPPVLAPRPSPVAVQMWAG